MKSEEHPGGLRDGISRALVRTAVCALAAAAVSCASDLREDVGPRVPLPNLRGLVLRAGAPAPDVKIAILTRETEAEFESVRTGGDGSFAVSEMPAGAWTLEVDSSDPAEFSKATFEFEILEPDTVVLVPQIDIALRGLRLRSPQAADTLDPPGFLRPVTFEWDPLEDESVEIQVRLYREDGEAVWYGDRTTSTQVRWNGLANRGDGAGRPVGPGAYYWRLRLHGEGALEYTTASRPLHFRGSL